MMIPAGIADRRSRSSCPGTPRSTSETAGPTSRRSSVGENIERFTDGVGVESRRGPLFYLPVVLSDSFPWSLCLFGAAGLWLADGAAGAVGRRVRTRADRATAPSGSARCSGSGSWSSSAFFSLSAGEAGPLHLSDRAGGRGARRAVHRAERAERRARAAPDAARNGGRHRRFSWRSPAPGRCISSSRRASVYALDGAAFVGGAGALGGLAALVLAATNRSRGGVRGRPRRPRHAQLGVRRARAAELRALQAGAGLERGDPRAPGPGRRGRALQRRAAEHGLLPAAPHRPCSSIARSSCSGCAAGARVYAVLSANDYAAPAARDRRSDLRARAAADLRREAEDGPRPRSAAGTAADHEPVQVTRSVTSPESLIVNH